MLRKLRHAFKQATCSHFRKRTTVTLRKGELETSTRCEECSRIVPPDISFSEQWKYSHLVRSRAFAEGQSEVVFDG